MSSPVPSVPPPVVEIAAAVRSMVLEHIVRPHPTSGIDDTDLEGACAICAYILVQALRIHGYHGVRFVQGVYKCMPHCWVTWRGWVIDPTATQFNADFDLVHVVPQGGPYVPERTGVKAHRWVQQWGTQSPWHYRQSVRAIIDSFRVPCEDQAA